MTDLTYFLNLNQRTQREQDSEEVCIANISPLERQKRLKFALQQFIFTLLVFGVLIVFQVNPLWRLSLLFLFWAAAVGYFQARDKT